MFPEKVFVLFAIRNYVSFPALEYLVHLVHLIQGLLISW